MLLNKTFFITDFVVKILYKGYFKKKLIEINQNKTFQNINSKTAKYFNPNKRLKTFSYAINL